MTHSSVVSDSPVTWRKWISETSPGQPVREAAAQILKVRLSAVWHWLPLAADKSDVDVEYVHQLRTASRRAAEAVRIFSEFVDAATSCEIRSTLRQIRRAADGARNLDVLGARFVDCRSSPHSIREDFRRRRAEAQFPIVSLYRELLAASYERQIDRIVRAVAQHETHKTARTLGHEAPRYLKKSWDRFFDAANADLANDETLHDLRIFAKKLRYSMEPLFSAFSAEFRNRLYPQITFVQDFLGRINNQAMATSFFRQWLEETKSPEQKAFLAGLLAAVDESHDDLRQTFLAYWTPDVVSGLRRRFKACCGRG